MSELRRDTISGQWVLFAADRAGRPQDFDTVPIRRPDAHCPFCRGREEETPASLAIYPAANEGDWLVRVIPNRYPATYMEAGGNGTARAANTDELGGLTASLPARGRHEVIVESPRHVPGLAELSEEELQLTFIAYRDRLRATAEAGMAYGIVFKNCGPAAGATLEHIHSQLLGLPVVPDAVLREAASAEKHHQTTGRCVWCDVLAAELSASQRIVEVTERYAAYCPYASRFAYQTCLIPRRHAARFEESSDAELAELAHLARRTALRLGAALNNPAYNYFLRTAPFDTNRQDHYHWQLEIFPRTTTPAGFEWATGCFINPVPPEAAAAALRAALPER